MTDPEVVSHYFDLLAQTIADNDLLDKQCQTFNMDESGMPLDLKQGKGVFQRGVKNVLAPSSGNLVVAISSFFSSCFHKFHLDY